MTRTPDQNALLAALQQLLQPVARLALARGLSHAALDELLRVALVEQACQLPGVNVERPTVSRVSTATGLSRREVSRLLGTEKPAAQAATRWLAGEVFARWMSTPGHTRDGQPLALPRQGPAPSFEALAHAITRDVHPRSLLDELCRLGLADWDPDSELVSLQRAAFVPSADFGHMTALLADNVGDHLAAAADNVLGDGKRHFEQAVFADELSAESVQALRPLISSLWAELFARLVPVLHERIDLDRAAGRAQDQRVRIGFYSFTAAMDSSVPPTAAPTPPGDGDPA